jgi:beta-phosphoglucomutase-like phosphatase (HAD superfamily)
MEGVAQNGLEGEAPARALIFELELLAVSGWSFLYDALKEVLPAHGVKVTIPVFSRYFASRSPELALKQMAVDLEKPELSGGEVMAAVKEAYVSRVKGADGVRDGLVKLIGDLRKHDIKLGALTCMEDDVVAGILEKLGLTSDDIMVLKSEHCGRAAPTAQDWLRLAKKMQISTSLCTVATTSSSSSKAALCSGMRCFAVPDKMTEFHDFGGADYVVSSLDEEVEELVVKLVEAF